jgi:hypothetical protein
MENAFQFLFLNKDAAIQNDYDMIMEELIPPFAKKVGMEFTMEEMNKVLSLESNSLSDDELDQVAAGRGEIIEQYSRKVIYRCEMVENNTEFVYYFMNKKNCPYYKGLYAGVTNCAWCKNLERNSWAAPLC